MRGRGERRRGAVARPLLSVAAVLALAAATLLVLQPLGPSFPGPDLDDSWTAVMGEAATWPARWGVDLDFTYGPGSALVTRYFTPMYLASVPPLLGALALTHALAIVLLARGAAGGRRGGAALIAAAVAADLAAVLAGANLDNNSFMFALAVALLLLDLLRRPGERLAAAIVLAGAALLGAAALSKTSFGVAASGAFAVADARAVAGLRRPPLLVPALLAGALSAFLAYGQRLSDLPSYLAMQGQVAAGYGEAMYLAPGRLELGAFLCLAAGLAAVAALCGAPGRGGRLAAGLGTACVLAIAVKAGFVRADEHTKIAWSLLGLAGMAVAVGPVLRRSARGAALLGALSLAVLWVVGPLFLLRATGRPLAFSGLPAVYADTGDALSREAAAWGRFIGHPGEFDPAAREDKAAAWAAIRAARPLPPLPGTVDILPSAQSAVLAAGLDYRPRPSFQGYSTYTAALIGANRAFYTGDRAPDWLIFGPDDLDDRYPNMAEGALWPELLRRYEPQRRAGPWIALRRRAEPLPDVLGEPRRLVVRLGERVGVGEGGAVFARIAVRETLLGRLAAALFRPPALVMRVSLRGGGDATYRFIPALGEGGFLLSPVVRDADAFAALAFGEAGQGVGPAVEAVTVGGSPWASLFYRPEVTVELGPVSLGAAPPTPAARDLADAVLRGARWRSLARGLVPASRFDGTRLSAPAPTALSVPVAGARRLRVGFGIADEAGTRGAVGAICFAVRAPAAEPLWRRCLDPGAAEADRGPQSAEVALPQGLAAAEVETTCAGDCAGGWSYWDDIAPLP